ncbi:MAG: WD40 repeat domain-containing protein [Hymenobacteraceae bacterium]|nr:WD40 repeat domain-containing protein [Hymenobacteraceae bacterium]MDX5397164.1 WD40 repeat domain-containing protein [Hymenobacteraceae bacterium]MDX5513239.1 WD40 repeat domain-containing protein [Hymenobacteraceae bacterium]
MINKVQVNKVANLTGHRDCVYTLEQATEFNRFYSAAGDGMVVAWNLDDPENGELIARVEASVYALRLMSDRNLLLIGHNMSGLQVIDLAQKTVLKALPLRPVPVFDIAYYPEQKYIYAGLGDGSLFQIDSETFSVKTVKKHSTKSLRCLALNTKHNELAAGYSDNFIRIFDADTLELKQEFEAHSNSVFTLAYTPNRRYLLSGSRDAHLKAWDAEKQYREHASVIAHMYTINHLTFSPDGRYLATCSMDKSIKVWDAVSLRLLKVIDKVRHAGHGTSVNKLFWSAHNNQLVSCSDDRSITVWDLKFSLDYEDNTVRNQTKNL